MNLDRTKTLFLYFIFSLLAAAAFAHTGSIKGGLYDAKTQKPIEGASVYIKELDKSTVTDVFGTYFFDAATEGDFTIIINHIGYNPVTLLVQVKQGITTSTTSMLSPSAVQISEIMVNARKDINLNAISGLDLKLRPVNSAQDMLRMVPGLFIAQHAGGGKAEQIFLRGFDLDHGTDINITVDGMPVNMVSHAHGQGYADLHFIIPELVEKIDFGKGPYYADKGNLATAGYVSFKTTDMLDNRFVKAETGNYGLFRTVAAINLLGKNEINNIKSAYIAGEYNSNRGYFDVPQNFTRLNLQGKFSNTLSANRMFTVGISAFRSNWDASGQIPERAVAEGIIGRFGQLFPGEGGNTSRYNMNILYSQAIDDKKLFKSNFFVSYYDFELYSNFTFFLNDSINGDQIRQKEKRFLSGYNSSYSSDFYIEKMKAKTELGAGFRYDNVIDDELSRTKNRRVTLAPLALGDINETNLFAYASQTISPLPKLTLNVALRYDYFLHDYYNKLDSVYNRQSYNTAAVSPKMNFNYSISRNASLYFRYGVGFHSNDTRVVIAQKGKDVLPLAYSYDIGTILKPHQKLLLSTGIWMMGMEDEFVYVGDEAAVESVGRTRRFGVDLSARYEVRKWLYLDADINWTHARLRDNAKGENYVPLAAAQTAIGGITLKPFKSFSASYRFRYIGDHPANEDYTVTAYGYTLFDAALSYTRPSFELGIQAQNIFNKAWNEAQFDTKTKLLNESVPVSEIHFTPGTPFFIKFSAVYKF